MIDNFAALVDLPFGIPLPRLTPLRFIRAADLSVMGAY